MVKRRRLEGRGEGVERIREVVAVLHKCLVITLVIALVAMMDLGPSNYQVGGVGKGRKGYWEDCGMGRYSGRYIVGKNRNYVRVYLDGNGFDQGDCWFIAGVCEGLSLQLVKARTHLP